MSATSKTYWYLSYILKSIISTFFFLFSNLLMDVALMKMTLYDLLRHNKKYDSFSELMIHVYSKKTHWYTETIWWGWFFSSEFLTFLTTDIIFNTSIFPQDFFSKWKWQLNNNSVWFFLPKGIFLIIYILKRVICEFFRMLK